MDSIGFELSTLLSILSCFVVVFEFPIKYFKKFQLPVLLALLFLTVEIPTRTMGKEPPHENQNDSVCVGGGTKLPSLTMSCILPQIT